MGWWVVGGGVGLFCWASIVNRDYTQKNPYIVILVVCFLHYYCYFIDLTAAGYSKNVCRFDFRKFVRLPAVAVRVVRVYHVWPMIPCVAA